jgi:hypothetical protein
MLFLETESLEKNPICVEDKLLFKNVKKLFKKKSDFIATKKR